MFMSSLGSTETAPAALACCWQAEHAGNIGLPLPGVELKLVPREGKLEARLRGANITPGYWRAEALTRNAFDDEGFYKIGDALKFEDPADPAKGLLFDGRLAEDFKLATGTWVSVGPLRAAFIAHFAPLARDVVLAGENRDEVTALVFPTSTPAAGSPPASAPTSPHVRCLPTIMSWPPSPASSTVSPPHRPAHRAASPAPFSSMIRPRSISVK